MNTSQKVIVESIREKISGRRSFVRQMGMASAGLGAFLATVETADAQVTDVDILQFALNLEYLEAEFYTVARTGKTIDQMGVGITGSGTTGATTGGKQVTFIEGSTLAKSADEIGADERAHVTLLRTALSGAGVMPVAKPAINLNALGAGFGSQEEFILLARAFEDVGVSAYGAAAPLISSKAYLGVAARILAAEAEHTGNLRLHATLYNVKTTALDPVDILPPPSGTRFMSLDAQGLSAVRTPGQVLYIVYGGQPGAKTGAFFPGGMNGNLNTADATPAKP
ncbi:ferritin-like domain-containing protein [Bryobacter aggregatus]|uniref:ferritin-like domain-containing protein n=1 Tax=Bryobacter aggregatus TaxID=360054 RepID=UPI000568E64D|nr:ferritin-like domain-containing protein [Bryobacter aggregatus]